MTYGSDKPLVVPSKLPPLKTHQAILDNIKRKPAKEHIDITLPVGGQFDSVLDVAKANREKSALELKKQKRKATKILLLESDQVIRNQIKVAARSAGFDVCGVSSFIQVKRTIAIRPEFGVVILGVNANADDIVDMATLLNKKFADVSLVALVDYSDRGWVSRLVDQGHIFRCIEKPINADDFEWGLDSAIKRHRMLRKMNNLSHDHYKKSSLFSAEKLKGLFKKIA